MSEFGSKFGMGLRGVTLIALALLICCGCEERRYKPAKWRATTLPSDAAASEAGESASNTTAKPSTPDAPTNWLEVSNAPAPNAVNRRTSLPDPSRSSSASRSTLPNRGTTMPVRGTTLPMRGTTMPMRGTTMPVRRNGGTKTTLPRRGVVEAPELNKTSLPYRNVNPAEPDRYDLPTARQGRSTLPSR